MACHLSSVRARFVQNLRVHPQYSQRCGLHTSRVHHAIGLFAVAARAHARETQHFARASRLNVVNHVPTLEAIKSSEVDVWQNKKQTDTSSVGGTIAKNAPTAQSRARDLSKPSHEWWVHQSERSPEPLPALSPASELDQSTLLDLQAKEQEIEKLRQEMEALEEEFWTYKIKANRQFSALVTSCILIFALSSYMMLSGIASDAENNILLDRMAEKELREQSNQAWIWRNGEDVPIDKSEIKTVREKLRRYLLNGYAAFETSDAHYRAQSPAYSPAKDKQPRPIVESELLRPSLEVPSSDLRSPVPATGWSASIKRTVSSLFWAL